METDMATTKNEIIDALLQRMDDALANGQRLPWQKPWEPQFGERSAPHNPITLEKHASGSRLPDTPQEPPYGGRHGDHKE